MSLCGFENFLLVFTGLDREEGHEREKTVEELKVVVDERGKMRKLMLHIP